MIGKTKYNVTPSIIASDGWNTHVEFLKSTMGKLLSALEALEDGKAMDDGTANKPGESWWCGGNLGRREIDQMRLLFAENRIAVMVSKTPFTSRTEESHVERLYQGHWVVVCRLEYARNETFVWVKGDWAGGPSRMAVAEFLEHFRFEDDSVTVPWYPDISSSPP